MALAETQRNNPYLGRAGTESDVRELVVGGTPYLIFYRLRGTRLVIPTIWHGSRERLRLKK